MFTSLTARRLNVFFKQHLTRAIVRKGSQISDLYQRQTLLPICNTSSWRRQELRTGPGYVVRLDPRAPFTIIYIHCIECCWPYDTLS